MDILEASAYFWASFSNQLIEARKFWPNISEFIDSTVELRSNNF